MDVSKVLWCAAVANRRMAGVGSGGGYTFHGFGLQQNTHQLLHRALGVLVLENAHMLQILHSLEHIPQGGDHLLVMEGILPS